MTSRFIQWTKSQTAPGILLIIAALSAMAASNTRLSTYYNVFLDLPMSIGIGKAILSKPLVLWINEGLMSLFFLYVGLEIKYELYYGQLKTPESRRLPLCGALGGMIVPALIYLLSINGQPMAHKGWAIPTATDIAFSLAVLSLFGNRLPKIYQVFLTTLAVIDDLGAILIIALFYSSNISTYSLIFSLICLCVMIILNRYKIKQTGPYLVTAILMWLCVIKSGVHATMVGVALAFCLPMTPSPTKDHTLDAWAIKKGLEPWLSFFILPIFAFANSGIAFVNLSAHDLLTGIPRAISLGLLVGKPLGVISFCYLACKLGISKASSSLSSRGIIGLGCLCGIGFTMSLFIGTLAFEHTVDHSLLYPNWVRLGVLAGSIGSACLGYFILSTIAKRKTT